MTIVNTAGWDTDCNSGNVGCLIGVMHSLKGLEGGPDWRGPLADRTLISASDGGYAVNDAVSIAYDIANLGRELADLAPLPPPKAGAQFHFSLPGSVQGFMAERETPRMATSGALMIGVNAVPPMPPRLEIVKLPPCISEANNLPARAFSESSPSCRAIS